MVSSVVGSRFQKATLACEREGVLVSIVSTPVVHVAMCYVCLGPKETTDNINYFIENII